MFAARSDRKHLRKFGPNRSARSHIDRSIRPTYAFARQRKWEHG
jgi:hypothetical protein